MTLATLAPKSERHDWINWLTSEELEQLDRLLLAQTSQTIWPSEFATDSADCATAFVLAQRTWNEAEGQIQPMPDKSYIREYCREWWTCRSLGQTLITEKCRRMVISWVARSLELWAMGLKRTDCILVGEDLEQAAKHVWRLEFLYGQLSKRLNLPPSSVLRYEGDRKLKQFNLANGSQTTYANGQEAGLQGDGTAIITMEEFGIYRYAKSMLAQAQIITQGSAGSTGGFVNIITNSSTHPEWQEIKATFAGD